MEKADGWSEKHLKCKQSWSVFEYNETRGINANAEKKEGKSWIEEEEASAVKVEHWIGLCSHCFMRWHGGGNEKRVWAEGNSSIIHTLLEMALCKKKWTDMCALSNYAYLWINYKYFTDIMEVTTTAIRRREVEERKRTWTSSIVEANERFYICVSWHFSQNSNDCARA